MPSTAAKSKRRQAKARPSKRRDRFWARRSSSDLDRAGDWLLENLSRVRAEQTNVKAFAPLTDAARNIRRDAQGGPILGANGRPQAITTDPLEVARLTMVERGSRVDREFLRVLPNINAAYNLRENLILRGAHYYSMGRPLLNQYAGALTLPDTENLPSATNRIVVTNPASSHGRRAPRMSGSNIIFKGSA